MPPTLFLALALTLTLAHTTRAAGRKPAPAFRTSGLRHLVVLRTGPEIEPRIASRATSGAYELPGARQLALQPASFTPYDRYLTSVRRVINSLRDERTTMLTVCRVMKESHAFEYRTSDPYRAEPPSLTEARRAGDCKAKALWLYHRLGDSSALYVIGKALKRARTSHAWVYWRADERWWILDPTNRAEPIAADSVPADRYVPYYSYGKTGAFRHKATELYLAQDSRRDRAVAVAASAPKSRSRRK